jgi:hypothetical protein
MYWLEFPFSFVKSSTSFNFNHPSDQTKSSTVNILAFAHTAMWSRAGGSSSDEENAGADR